MIEKMKMIHIVTTVSGKEEMLKGLREIGIVHLAEKKAADRVVADRLADLSKTASMLLEYADKKAPGAEVLSDSAFEKMYAEVQAASEKKTLMAQEISAANAELDRIQAWGEFSPAELKAVYDQLCQEREVKPVPVSTCTSTVSVRRNVKQLSLPRTFA